MKGEGKAGFGPVGKHAGGMSLQEGDGRVRAGISRILAGGETCRRHVPTSREEIYKTYKIYNKR